MATGLANSGRVRPHPRPHHVQAIHESPLPWAGATPAQYQKATAPASPLPNMGPHVASLLAWGTLTLLHRCPLTGHPTTAPRVAIGDPRGGTPGSGSPEGVRSPPLGNHEAKVTESDEILTREEANRWASTSNLVATTLLLSMGGLWDGTQRLITAAEAFRNSATDAEVAQLFPLFVAINSVTSQPTTFCWITFASSRPIGHALMIRFFPANHPSSTFPHAP